MKICFISPLFSPKIIGGAEQYAKNLCDNISTNNKVIVITSKVPSKNFPGLEYKIIRIGQGNIDSLYNIIMNNPEQSMLKKITWHALDYWNFLEYIRIKKILKKEKPDIVHTNGISGFSSSLFSAIKDAAIPHIHSLNDYEMISPYVILFKDGEIIRDFGIINKAYIRHMIKISDRTDAIISPSRFILDFHKNLGFFKNSKTHIIPHSTRFKHKKDIKRKDQKQFIYFGQIVENKGVQTAIKAVLLQKNRDIILHVVGRGPYLHTVQKLAQDDPRVIFHGYLDDNSLESIFEKCSYCIVPSIWYEPFGMVIIEAMSKGLPVIASKIGAIPELVDDKINGFLFEPGDHKSLGRIIKEIQNNKEYDKMVSNAINFAKGFSFQKQVDETLKVYKSVLKK